MASLNKICLIGYLGRDPEIRYLPSGDAVCNFTIATTENWTDRNGEKQEKTTWFRVAAWKRLGEICGEYLARGKQVYVEGRISVDEWTDREGNNRFTLVVTANQVLMLGRKDDVPRQSSGYDAPRQSSGYDAPRQPPAPQQSSDMPESQHMEPPGLGPEEDDIPF